MGRKNNRVSTEARGGDRINWNAVRAGEPLPALPPDEIAETPDQPGLLDYDAHGVIEIDNGLESEQ